MSTPNRSFADRLFALGYRIAFKSIAVRTPRPWQQSSAPLTRRLVHAVGGRAPQMGRCVRRARSPAPAGRPHHSLNDQLIRQKRRNTSWRAFRDRDWLFHGRHRARKVRRRAQQTAADAATAQQAFQNDLATNSAAGRQRPRRRRQPACARAGPNSRRRRDERLGIAQADRAAMQPIVDAQRAAKLGTLQATPLSPMRRSRERRPPDRNMTRKAKSIFLGKDAQGNPTYSVDGQSVPSQDAANQLFEQKHGTRMANYYNVAAHARFSRLCSRMAILIERRRSARRTATPISSGRRRSLGRLEGARRRFGNWDGVNEHLNAS